MLLLLPWCVSLPACLVGVEGCAGQDWRCTVSTEAAAEVCSSGGYAALTLAAKASADAEAAAAKSRALRRVTSRLDLCQRLYGS